VDEALKLAASSQISIAVTNPCVELWFLLHFQDQTADLHRHKAQEISSDLLGCAKVPTVPALIELVGRYEDARRRARALDHKHELDGSPPRSNPSSSLWCLVDQIRGSEHT
jgi:RloB-like protein